MPRSDSATPNMALFCDFENVALGVREARYDAFDIKRVLERLLLKGSIVVKKAYCDWERYKDYKTVMHQAAFELIEIPQRRVSGKNSADIRMVVDALDLCYTKSHVDCFVIISGDSDFSPLVSKLRENAKTVIGVGVKNSTSDLLMSNCDEFIFYDDLVRESRRRSSARAKPAASDKPAASGRPDRNERGERGERADRGDKTERAERGERTEKADRALAVERLDVQEGGEVAPQAADEGHAPAPKRNARSGARRGRGAKAAAGSGSDVTTEVTTEAAADAATDASADADGTMTADASLTREGDAALDASRSMEVGVSAPSGLTVDASLVPASAADEPADAEVRLQRGLDLVVETLDALVAERGEDERIWGSMIKQTLKRRNPGFNEGYFGFKSFNRMLEVARDRRMLSLEIDEKSGGYVVRSL